MEPSEYQKQFKEVLLRFYLIASSKFMQPTRAQQMLIKLFRYQNKNPIEKKAEVEEKSPEKIEIRQKTQQKEQHKEIRVKSKSQSGLKITINGFNPKNTLQTSRSKSTLNSQTSKLVSGFGPLFHTEWVYSSKDPGKVLTFAYLAVCILRDYKFGFDKLYAMIKDHLRERLESVPPWASAAEREWNQIREFMNRSTGVKWQSALRKFINNLTDVFTNMVAMFAATPVEPGEPFGYQVAKRLAFSGQTSVVYFSINYKELQSIQRVVGSRNIEISIGFLQHCGVYVVASHPPSVSDRQSKYKELKGMLSRTAESALEELQLSDDRHELVKYTNSINEKQSYIKKYLNKKLARYGLDPLESLP